MAKNVIIMIGDGMGWEPARAAAIAKQIQQGQIGTKLSDFYTEGKGEGLSFQGLKNYAIATTYGTTIPNQEGVYSTHILHQGLKGEKKGRETNTLQEQWIFLPTPKS
ncbi:hypothetical protein [Trichocoleus sp. FACHB-262]|uniref:hypothetical protein n=1 Tax=Trichocoleus sp. FACHB-262 TaxID=2692869 RepID=UPI0018EFD92F|nr:hypothetical protein [Trichocoleus sp. FACHB-262]